MLPPKTVTRPALAGDMAFLAGCFLRSMRDTITACRGEWNEARELAQFENQLDLGETQIVRIGEMDVGFFMLVQRREALQLHTLCVAPEHQRQGIGSSVTTAVIRQGAESGRAVILSVLKVNKRAEALYQRLGFRVVEQSEHHRHMKYRPEAG